MTHRGPHARLADAVALAALGSLDAQRALALLRLGADDDALYQAVRAVIERGEPHRLRAFCRVLQKRLIEANE